MKKQNYTIGQKLMAYILLTGLFLQSCNNPYLGPSFNKEQAITKEEQPNNAALFLETPPLATELREPREKEGLVTQRADSGLGDELATTGKVKEPESQLGTSSTLASSTQQKRLATKQEITTIKQSQLTQFSSKLSSKEQTKSKPVRKRLQAPNLVHEIEQQVKATPASLVVEQTPQEAKQVVEKAPMLTKGRFQMTFEQTSQGSWKAIVNESFQVGISRKIELPVFFELGYHISHVVHSHWVHVIEEGPGSFIWVGSVGIKGGMYQEDEDNNNKSNRNSNSSKAEVTPSDLSGKLRYLYEQDNTLPKLIEDEDIPEQRIEDYYVKLQVVLQENFGEGRSAAARDQVVGEKKPVEVDKLFDEIDKDHPAVSKVLLLGAAGIGKSTLMHYISYQWAHGKLWKDKYEHVFRVRLKDLLDPTWAKKANKSDLLARFIYSCLDRQKTALAVKGNEQLEEMGYDLDEIQQLLKDPSKKEKVLLLVDGYDEITSLKGKPEYQKIVDLGIFKHPKVIMTSRPHAASKEIRAKFERQVESQGLDEAGINQYISLQFKQEPVLGEKLKDFLASNIQVRSMCEVPINTALLCITWKDPTISGKLTSSLSIERDFKLGQLYQDLIVWLGKRHAIKYNPVYQNPKVLRELSDEAVLEEEIFKALERIAYQSFTGLDLEEQARQGGRLAIPGQLVDQLARKESKLSLSQLHQYGLLRGEGDPNKPLEQVYYFIHLTFQEYLTAHRLSKLLSQEDKTEVVKVATWIAHHRNEPKYLMTFKFLAGLVSQSEDKDLVRRFWEALSCNVDGIIELGVEGKVKLFMHLLSQSKIGDQFDQRIPNIAQIAKLVDSTLQGDLLKWEQAIIEAGYYPTWLQGKASKWLEGGIGLARKASLNDESRMRLQAAARLLSKMVNQGGRLSREQLFDQFMELVQLKDWQLQKLGLEQAWEIVDKTVPAPKIEESAKGIVELLVDANLQGAARTLFAKLCQIDKAVFNHLRPLLADGDWKVQRSTADALREIVKLVPGKELVEALKPLFADSHEYVRWKAFYALREIVKLVPEFGKEGMEALKPLLADSHEDVRWSAADALIEIVKLVPELGKEVMEALKPLLADSHEYVRRSAANALKEIVKLVPGLGKEVLGILNPLLADSHEDVRRSVANALIEIVKLVPELGKEGMEALKPLLADSNKYIRISTVDALREIVKLVPELRKEVWEALKPLLADSHEYVRSSAADALIEIVKLVPGKELVEALKPLLADSNEDVRKIAVHALGEVVKLVPGKEVMEALKPLLADSNEDVRSSAAYALREIVKLVPELRKEVWETLKPLLADSNKDVRISAADALEVIVKSVPELRKEVMEALKPLLADSNGYVRSSAAYALTEIVKLVPELRKEVWQALKSLLADSNEFVRRHAGDALIEIVKSVPELRKEVMEALKPLLADSNHNVGSSAAYALREIVKLVPELRKEGMEALKPLLADSNEYVRSSAFDALREIVKLVPELRKEVWEAFKPLLADSHEDVRRVAVDVLKGIVQSASELAKELLGTLKPLLADSNERVRISPFYALKDIVKLVPKLGKEVWEALKPLVADSHEDVRSSAADVLSEIVKLVPELRKEVWEAFKPLLTDSNERVRRRAADALEEIVKLVPLTEPISLLADANPTVRQAVKKGLITKFKSAEKINHQELGSLIKLVAAHQGAQEELDKALYVAAHQALQQLAGTLDSKGIQWLNEHFTELPTLPVVQTFLKAVIAKTLEDKMQEREEASLLTKCIVETGLTATINPQANQIILEGNTYTLQPAAQANLTHVVNEVIKLSKDPMAQQYKLYQPLFKNSGEGLPIATTDIEKAVSILDKTPLNNDSWHVSVLDLSDNHRSKPSTTFILLEQRNYAGQHVIHQLELPQGEGKASSYAMNPLAVDEMKQKIFGELYLMKNPRYYGYSFTLSQKLGEELIKAASQIKGAEDSYSVLHGLAGDYKAMQVNQKETPSDLLSLPWASYSKNPAVKTYEKEEVYGKAMGLVKIKIKELNVGIIGSVKADNIENVNTENIEKLKAENVTNVNAENLINS